MFNYRLWQPADLPWLQQVAALAAWESLSTQERAAVSPAVVAQRAAEQCHQVLSSPTGTALIASLGSQPVGYALAALGPDSTTGEWNGQIFGLWVAPGYRRRRVGTTLRQLTEQAFSSHGIRKVKFYTGVHNLQAIGMAARAGYQVEGRIGLKTL